MQGLSAEFQGTLLPLVHLRFAAGNALFNISNKRGVRNIRELIKPGIIYANLRRQESNSLSNNYAITSCRGTGMSGEQAQRIFASFAFYKGKSAMNITPIKPLFKLAETGSAYIHREGALFLEIAPAIGQRKYDWSKKQTFALSVLELGTLVGLSPEDGCEFFHDPNIGKSNAGMIRKVFKVDPLSDKSGYFFNLAISNKPEKFDGRLSIPVTKAEFAVIRSAINYIIPFLIGWHVFVDPLKLEDCMLSDSNLEAPRNVRDARLEWAKRQF